MDTMDDHLFIRVAIFFLENFNFYPNTSSSEYIWRRNSVCTMILKITNF